MQQHTGFLMDRRLLQEEHGEVILTFHFQASQLHTPKLTNAVYSESVSSGVAAIFEKLVSAIIHEDRLHEQLQFFPIEDLVQVKF